MFTGAQKFKYKTFANFFNRLRINLDYYLRSKAIENDYERLFNLLITYRLKSTLSPDLREQARISEGGKWKFASLLAETLDIYEGEREEFNTFGGGLSGGKFKGKAFTPSNKNSYNSQGNLNNPQGNPCSFCKQSSPTHTPINCWHNPDGPKFRPGLNRTISRVSNRYGTSHSLSPNFSIYSI